MDEGLFSGSTTVGEALAAAAASKTRNVPAFDAPYAPVMATEARVIAAKVGLRPYRRSGFVVRAEKFGRNTVVHNYGHGGCGVTLSWGSAQLALAAARRFEYDRAIVIGAGVVGLSTAILLARRGVATTVCAESLPPQTTSSIAAALWQPTTLFHPGAVGDEFLARYRFAARVSQAAFQHYANDPRYGVRWIRMLTLHDARPEGPPEPRFEGDDLYPGLCAEEAPDRYFGFPYTDRHYAMVIDPDLYLPALMEDFQQTGGRIVMRRFETPDDVFRLDEPMTFNCTGFGAKALFGDDELEPIRGQLALLRAQPEIDYGYILASADHGLLYMLPRHNALVLGGGMGHGDVSLAPDDADKRRMLDGHAAIAARASRAQSIPGTD